MKDLRIIDIEAPIRNGTSFDESMQDDNPCLGSWGGLFARRLLKRYPDMDLEVWTSSGDVKQMRTFRIQGVDCRVFPNQRHLYSVVTWAMVRELKRIGKKHRICLYRSSIFDWQFILVSALIFPKARIVASHHGGRVPRGDSVRKRVTKQFQELSFHKLSAATYLRREIRDWIHQASPRAQLSFLPVGASFTVYHPLDKTQCRQELGLDVDKRYAVYVGSFYRLKGVDLILELYHEFQGMGFEVLLVGGAERDELFDQVKKSGCRHWAYVNWDLLQKIYSAADFYIHPAFHPKFGGLDVTLMESLACGTPVLSPQLLEYDFDTSELGMAVSRQEEFRERFIDMMEQSGAFTRCREVAMRYLDGESSIIDRLYKVLNHQS